MIILLTNIEFNVFKALPNKQEYIENSNFFYLQKVYDKSDVISILDTVVWWYSIWEKTPLYVTVVTDRSWNTLVKGLKFKHKIEIAKTIPDELDNESRQRMILEDDRIFGPTDVAKISNEIANLNFNNTVRYYTRSLARFSQ